MGQLFEQQEDGSLKPQEEGIKLSNMISVYKELTGRSLLLPEDIRWITQNNPHRLNLLAKNS